MDNKFSHLNNMQREAVEHTQGPLLILAGAGSGKTTVLVNRVLNIIESGLARPYQVLAITFTNKAAGELRERLEKAIGPQASEIWASTFHSCCSRILRRFADRIGYTKHFAIYDTDDSRRVMKQCMRELGIDDRHIDHRSILSQISSAKDSLVSVDEFETQAGNDFRLNKIAGAYRAYQRALKNADAMDFDDIIYNTVLLLRGNEDVLELYQNQFKYIVVDEYQDTNHAQYILTSLLAEGSRNLCVVGDDDQSIYRFRGATIENILSFEQKYPDAKVIRLEQNYRSTQNILDGANAVIKNNRQRKGKNLWTANGDGDKIFYKTCVDEMEESRFIADTVLENVKNGMKMSDQAVLYRMNAQSLSIERTFVKSGIPYRIIGGHRFYDRMEIKDVISYLCVLNNPNDSVRLSRIINVPKRGIGDTTINNAMEIGSALGMSLFEVIKEAENFEKLSRSAKKLSEFVDMIEEFIALSQSEIGLKDLMEAIIERTGYMEYLELTDREKFEDRKNNIEELYSTLLKYDEENPDGDLSTFLEEVALMSEIDNYDGESDTVVMMTIHSAKGLEFPVVYIPGMEENIFPGRQSQVDNSELEEERRLAYVGITRAKKKLYLLNASRRMLYGQTTRNRPSRFIDEIPSKNIEDKTVMPASSFSVSVGNTPARTYNRSFSAPSTTKAAAPSQSFNAGDTVMHKVFGQGVVLSAQAMGSDILLEIAFEKAGTKKLMSKFAKLTKV